MPNKPMIIATKEEIAQLNAPDDIAQRVLNIIEFLHASENVAPEHFNDPDYLELMISQLLSQKPEGDVISAAVNSDVMMRYYNPDLSQKRQLKHNVRFLLNDIGMPSDVLASRPGLLTEILELQKNTYEETCLDELMKDENILPHDPEIDAIHARQEAANYLQYLPFALPSLTSIIALPLLIADSITRALPTAKAPLEDPAQEESSYLLPAVATGVAVGLAGWGLWQMTRRNAEPSTPNNSDTVSHTPTR